MPLYLRNKRRRGKTLREEVLGSKAFDKQFSNFPHTARLSDASSRSRKRSSISSLKGSFLSNKLDNPLFKSLMFRKSALAKVSNADSDSESSRSSASDTEEDERLEQKSKSGTKITNLDSRWKWPFLFGQRNKTKKTQQLRLSSSSDSGSSEISNLGSVTTEDEAVDTLTKIEDSISHEANSECYLLYNAKGQPVRLKFFFDYLQITTVPQRTTLRRRSRRAKREEKIVYYEELALWTNNNDCLKLIHVRNKETAQQHRTEIKLFVNTKKQDVTPKQLNDELKDRVSVLMAEKLSIKTSEARKILQKSASENDVKRVVEEIDRNGEKCLAKDLANISLEDDIERLDLIAI